MDFTLTLNVSVEHLVDMPHLVKEQIVATLIEAVAEANPIMFGEDEAAPSYEVLVWDVEEA